MHGVKVLYWWRHFSVCNDIMTAMLNILRRLKNRTPSVDAYLVEEKRCQISSRYDLKRQAYASWSGQTGHPNKKNNNNINKKNKMSSDIRSVHDAEFIDFYSALA